MPAQERPVRVAVDGGGSKTVVAVVDEVDGRVLSTHRGPGCRYDVLGLSVAAAVVDRTVMSALDAVGVRADAVQHAGLYLTTIDFPTDEDAWRSVLPKFRWATNSFTVENDIFALLRSGTAEPCAAAVVCGTGMNGVAIGRDGERARLPALGRLSGDFGGGAGLAAEILWHAARAEDGRGPDTALRDALLDWTASPTIFELLRAIRFGETNPEAWMARMPELLSIADAGDRVAGGLVRRQGEEIGVVAAALLRRLGLEDEVVPVVGGGGLLSSAHPGLLCAARGALHVPCPNARLVLPDRAPISGAIDLVLEWSTP